jgi:4'-phosphopantetheinyl transferase
MSPRHESFLWCPAPKPLAIHDGEVHIWRAVLDISATRLPDFLAMLSDDEHHRAARYRFSRDRERFIVRRGFLRAILASYLAAHPAELRFSYTDAGKPFLVDSAGAPLPNVAFSASHSEGLALYAVTCDRAVGVDVERLQPSIMDDGVADKFFSSAENAAMRELPRSIQPLAFFNCWTRKEAFLKATGDGLTVPLPEVQVSLSPHEPAALLRVPGNTQTSLWSLHEIFPGTGFVGAVAVKAGESHIRCFQATLDALLSRGYSKTA